MIYLMRHGADDPDRLGGWSRNGLTEEGRRQVHTAKESLFDKGIEKLYASDLPRASETAEIVAEFLHLPIRYTPQFRETNNGLLAGMLKTEARERYPSLRWSSLEWTQAFPGGESPEMFFERTGKAWSSFKAAVQNETVLLVTHGGVINAILCIENKVPFTNREMHYRIPCAGIISIG